ncbi:unnamed protein product [Rangifer tarandus platyrhynchus]|uniref:Uncharacterized protein n=1 Tax=Rangifer tarandus platyrhynchus TaxID=3082113 RepID=A0ABN8ZHG5_RANTA|nr:unnamed protein product [Rangifer tarandus platyrhynchus]
MQGAGEASRSHGACQLPHTAVPGSSFLTRRSRGAGPAPRRRPAFGKTESRRRSLAQAAPRAPARGPPLAPHWALGTT